jgi:hypothetical protein
MNLRPPLGFLAACGLSCFCGISHAQVLTTNNVWAYSLLEGSVLVDDCYCGRPTIEIPMRGTFNLTLLDNNPLFARYELRDISFVATNEFQAYAVTGSGVYQIGGEVALVQDLSLTVEIKDSFTNRLCYLTNELEGVKRRWPMIQSLVTQTNGLIIQFFRIELAAAPLREIWGSTSDGFTSAKWQSPTNKIGAGDLISTGGRIVKSNAELTREFGVMPPVPDVGLDAVDFAPGGEILFSINQNIFSERLNVPLRHGDLLSNRGTIVKRNQELLSAFGLVFTEEADAGFDAVHRMDDGQILFSISTDLIFPSAGISLSHGDILSDRGEIFRTNAQLFSRFHPCILNHDFGLEELYVWPSGEIWFSPNEGFQDSQLGLVQAGDILSDQGYRVFGNLELVSAFAPLEKPTDFGWDALFIVTDAITPAVPPSIAGIVADPSTGNVTIQWKGAGRVFQLERAATLGGPYLQTSPILPGLFFNDVGILRNQGQSFYSLRQW